MVPSRITTDRFVLRRFSRRDVEPLAEAVQASLPELSRWLPWAHPGYRRDDAASFVRESTQAWKEGRAFDFGIRAHHDPGRHLGNASIWHTSRMARSAEIGYWVRTDETSRGIATEVTAALIDLAFGAMGLHKVVLRIAVGNRASERVAEKLGFHRDGVLREELLIAGRWVDHTLYSLLSHEWQPARRATSETDPVA